jgi:hypothetical protein
MMSFPKWIRAGLGAKSMKTAFGRLLEQRQQFGLEHLHLLLSFGMGSGRIRHKLGPQPSILFRKPIIQGAKAGDLDRKPIVLVTKVGVLAREPVILGRKHHYLLLGQLGSGQGLVALLLPQLRPVAPETTRGSLSSITHGDPSPEPQARKSPKGWLAWLTAGNSTVNQVSCVLRAPRTAPPKAPRGRAHRVAWRDARWVAISNSTDAGLCVASSASRTNLTAGSVFRRLLKPPRFSSKTLLSVGFTFLTPPPFDSQANHSADTILTTFARFGAHR